MRVCPRCGRDETQTRFYRSQKSWCAPCHNAAQVASRQANPERYARVKRANNDFQRRSPDSNREAQQRWRENQRRLIPAWQPPATHMLIQDAQRLLRCTRQRVNQLIDTARLEAYKEHGKWVISRASVDAYLGLAEREVGE